MSAVRTARLGLVICFLLGPVPAPGSESTPAELFQQSRDYAAAGDDDAALQILDQLRAAYPHDVDYVFARAQLLARQHRDAEALEELREAMRLAPDYDDVRQFYESLQARQQRAPDDAAQWSILAGAGYQRLDNGMPAWNEQFAELSRSQRSTGTYRLGIARDARFDTADITVSTAADINLASGWLAGLAFAVANDADFRPQREFSGNIGRSLQDGWVVGVRYRRREFETIAVTSVAPSVEKYQGQFRTAYAVTATQLPGASTVLGHGLTVNWYYNDRASIALAINAGVEAEAVGLGQILETRVKGVSLSGRRQLSDRFGLQWWLGLHQQGDFYRRDYFGLAVSIKL
jgi:YaiO family outer membrane protein